MTDDNMSGASSENAISLAELISVFKKRFKPIIFIFSLAIISSCVYHFYTRQYYSSDFIILPRLINPNQASLLLDDFAVLAGNDNSKEFHRINNVSADDLSQLKSIKSFIIDEKSLKITVNTYDPKSIPAIAKGIVSFLNNNSYIKNINTLEKNKLEKVLEAIKIEIKELEGLKNPIKNLIINPQSTGIGVMHPHGVSVSIINLKEKEFKILKDLSLLTGFDVLKEPVTPINPKGPNLIKNLLLASLLSLVVGIFVAIILELSATAQTDKA
ncbi:MAG: hypothetical protein JKY33_01025 [Bacteroidia bacterium]|nr:hypothetical protein [Bacteroidia bacterium]